MECLHFKNINYKKYLTFSFDDGVTQDLKLIKILDKYGLKATFNINSSLLGLKGEGRNEIQRWNTTKILPSQVINAYNNHEVAVHTLTHPNLTKEDDETVVYQVEEDRTKLQVLSGQKIVGMAYPCGGENNNDHVAEIIKENTGILYARTIKSRYSFDVPKDAYRLDPTVHICEVDKLYALAQKFLGLNAETECLFYIWGHSYELDVLDDGWEMFESFCKLIAAKNDIYYGTNTDVLSKLGVI